MDPESPRYLVIGDGLWLGGRWVGQFDILTEHDLVLADLDPAVLQSLIAPFDYDLEELRRPDWGGSYLP